MRSGSFRSGRSADGETMRKIEEGFDADASRPVSPEAGGGDERTAAWRARMTLRRRGFRARSRGRRQSENRRYPTGRRNRFEYDRTRRSAPVVYDAAPMTDALGYAGQGTVFYLHSPPRTPHQVANRTAMTTAIVAVDNHPIAHSARGSTKSPITSSRIAMSMMITINGTATTPLITADQNRALIGSRPTKLMPTPTRVVIAIVT